MSKSRDLNIIVLEGNNEAFEPDEARELAQRLEVCCTPKHGSLILITQESN